jgi:hypothetical protein
MTERATSTDTQFDDEEDQTHLWGGMIAFAALMLTLMGGFHVIGGFIALLEDNVYYQGGAEELFKPVTTRAFGIVHMAVGVVMLLAGYAVFWGKKWGRVTAVVVASIGAVTNLASLSAETPRFALMLVLDVLVIFAVVVHGNESREY